MTPGAGLGEAGCSCVHLAAEHLAHERETRQLGGGGAASPEYALWCAADSPIYAALKEGAANFETLAAKFADKKIIDIGAAPAAGSTKG